jgi:cobalt-zinc-cadmium efflux system outer membrane protein
MRRVGSIPAACSSCASIVIVLVASAAARADQAPPLDETALARLVWERAPGVLASRRGEIDARAWAERTRLLPNPVLGATWGTVPIGERNPPSAGFWSIPSYQVGVSELIELGKRGPRQRAADAATRVARFDALDAYRITFFDVLESLGDQAAAVARAAVLERLVADSAESVRLQRVRADKGDVATIEVERLEVEHARLTSSLREARVAREAALADCSTLLGALCPRFDREPDALAFLELAARERPTGTDVSALARRPDLLALDAVRDQSLAEATLAKRQVIPDPGDCPLQC